MHLDARRDEVDVPEHLRDDPMLILNLSRRFGLEVFEIGPIAVKASLGFGAERYLCVLPWTAIWAMTSKVDGEQAVFPEAVPPELMAAAQQTLKEMPEAERLAIEAEVAALKDDMVIKDPTDAPQSEPDPKPAPATNVPFLRIVK